MPEHAPPICAFWKERGGGGKALNYTWEQSGQGKKRLRDFFSYVLYAGAPKSQLDTFLQPVSSPAPVSEGDDDDDDV